MVLLLLGEVFHFFLFFGSPARPPPLGRYTTVLVTSLVDRGGPHRVLSSLDKKIKWLRPNTNNNNNNDSNNNISAGIGVTPAITSSVIGSTVNYLMFVCLDVR